MSQNYHEIAKDITIAAIEKGLIVAPIRPNHKGHDELIHANQYSANEIAKLYKTIAKAADDVLNRNFDTNHGQE
ncbi:hypothetical protein [Paenibacillus larvae]|uniref:Uncharacterized protein n=1 Tax=Paenibacillus larvae subsp. larvae TaxID=147375 RepID=A0A6C0QV34_9BACL|nr:hypothetical protein [Paenibacillus larvae]QHZ52371.1 hypothetical protein ERICV_03259 [Paenibacillus larvae subsp. larvae]